MRRNANAERYLVWRGQVGRGQRGVRVVEIPATQVDRHSRGVVQFNVLVVRVARAVAVPVAGRLRHELVETDTCRIRGPSGCWCDAGRVGDTRRWRERGGPHWTTVHSLAIGFVVVAAHVFKHLGRAAIGKQQAHPVAVVVEGDAGLATEEEQEATRLDQRVGGDDVRLRALRRVEVQRASCAIVLVVQRPAAEIHRIRSGVVQFDILVGCVRCAVAVPVTGRVGHELVEQHRADNGRRCGSCRWRWRRRPGRRGGWRGGCAGQIGLAGRGRVDIGPQAAALDQLAVGQIVVAGVVAGFLDQAAVRRKQAHVVAIIVQGDTRLAAEHDQEPLPW